MATLIAQGILALVKDSDATSTDPTKDRWLYKRGDFVELFPPGKEYNSPCAVPFYLIDVTGVPLTYDEVVARYMQPETDPNTGEPVRRRVYYVNLDTLPNPNKADLADHRTTVITWLKIRSSIKHKVTGQAEG